MDAKGDNQQSPPELAVGLSEVVVLVGQRAAETIATNLSFVGVRPSRLAEIDSPDTVLAVLVLPDVSASQMDDLVARFQGRQRAVPVFAVGMDGAPRPECALPSEFSLLGGLQAPLHLGPLVDALDRARAFRDARLVDGEKPISLFRALVGHSRAMQDVRRMIDQVAPTEASVLIQGESGTGKEVAARNIHYFSKHRGQPFVAVNCSAIPAELLESELFGHERGAFTGALKQRKGVFEQADGGTLFLDEIGDMPMAMQAKMLRVLEEQSFVRVGGQELIRTRARIVAATNVALEQAVEQGRFREDLYFRLAVFPLRMAPLRERIEDLPLLIVELVKRMHHAQGLSVSFSPAAILALYGYRWPGNIRELANFVQRMAILYPFVEVTASQLPSPYGDRVSGVDQDGDGVGGSGGLAGLGDDLDRIRVPDQGLDLKQHLTSIEVTYIQQALRLCQGNVSEAAKRLGMRRTTLVEKMRRYQLERP